MSRGDKRPRRRPDDGPTWPQEFLSFRQMSSGRVAENVRRIRLRLIALVEAIGRRQPDDESDDLE